MNGESIRVGGINKTGNIVIQSLRVTMIGQFMKLRPEGTHDRTTKFCMCGKFEKKVQMLSQGRGLDQDCFQGGI